MEKKRRKGRLGNDGGDRRGYIAGRDEGGERGGIGGERGVNGILDTIESMMTQGGERDYTVLAGDSSVCMHTQQNRS